MVSKHMKEQKNVPSFLLSNKKSISFNTYLSYIWNNYIVLKNPIVYSSHNYQAAIIILCVESQRKISTGTKDNPNLCHTMSFLLI